MFFIPDIFKYIIILQMYFNNQRYCLDNIHFIDNRDFFRQQFFKTVQNVQNFNYFLQRLKL